MPGPAATSRRRSQTTGPCRRRSAHLGMNPRSLVVGSSGSARSGAVRRNPSNAWTVRGRPSNVPTRESWSKYLTLVHTRGARHLAEQRNHHRIRKILFHTALRLDEAQLLHRRSSHQKDQDRPQTHRGRGAEDFSGSVSTERRAPP